MIQGNVERSSSSDSSDYENPIFHPGLERQSSGEYDNAAVELSPEQLQDEVTYIASLPGNDVCADCGLPEPSCASVTLGVFVCGECAKLHRALGRIISTMKEIKEGGWTSQHVEILHDIGNLKSKRTYEAHVPDYYKIPGHGDAKVLIAQWIRAKYQRREFVDFDSSRRPYETGYAPILLWKQTGRDDKFEQCRFELTDNSVQFYAKPKATKVKQTLLLEQLDLAFAPSRIPGNQHLLQITLSAAKPEVWLVYAEDGMHIVEWFQAVRAAKLRLRRQQRPDDDVTKLCENLTSDILVEGWVYKTGPRSTDSWKKRWVTLHGNKLLYSVHPQESSLRGCVDVGSVFNGCLVMDGLPSERRPHSDGFGFVLKTPTRDYHMSCGNMAEKKIWLDALKQVTRQEQARSRFH